MTLDISNISLIIAAVAVGIIILFLVGFLTGAIKKLSTMLISSCVVLVLTFASIYGYEEGYFDFFTNDKITNMSDTEMIENRIQLFLDAYNSGDMDGVLDCMDKKTKNLIESSMGITDGILNGLSGMDINMSEIFGLSVGMVSNGDLLNIDDVNINIGSDNAATVSAILTYEDKYSGASSETVTFDMVKENDDWYISDMN